MFAFARLLSAIPLTPGGLGVVEVALITGLAAAGGRARARWPPGCSIFRALTYVLPIPVGLATYVFWRRNRSWRRAAEQRTAHQLVPEIDMTAAVARRDASPRPRDSWPRLARGRGAARRRGVCSPAARR